MYCNITIFSNVVGSSISTIKTKTDIKKEEAKKWIENNLPQNKESTKLYYSKYKSYTEQNNIKYVGIQDFSNIVRTYGYTNDHIKAWTIM